MILTWFVDNEVIDAVVQNTQKTLIEEHQVEVFPERLPDAMRDENVVIHIVRQYFTNDAWMILEDAVRQKATFPYVCKLSFHNLHETDEESLTMACYHCLCWFHLKCTGLKKAPKTKFWFCRKCHESPFSE